MATLIAVETGGEVHGSCDAKCYNAMGPECSCACQGAHHGMGREYAITSTRELAAEQAPGDRLVYFLPDLEPGAEAEFEAEIG